MYFYSDVSICLPRNCSRFDEACTGSILLHIVVALSSTRFRSSMSWLLRLLRLLLLHRIRGTTVELLLATTH